MLKKEVSRKFRQQNGEIWKAAVAVLMIEVNSQKHGHVSRCCGRKFAEKSAAYVSAAREVIQASFIAHFFCKASMKVKIIESIAVKIILNLN